MARDSLVREAVRKTAVGRFDSGPCLFGAHAVDGRGRLAPGRVEARRLSPTFNGVVRVRVPPAGLSAVAQSAERLTIRCAPPHSPAFLPSPAAVTALAVRARVEDRRLPVLKNRNPPAVAASSVPAPEARPGGSKTAGYPGTGKLAGSSPAPCRYLGLGQLSRGASGVNSGCRIPHPLGRNPPTPSHPPGRAGRTQMR